VLVGEYAIVRMVFLYSMMVLLTKLFIALFAIYSFMGISRFLKIWKNKSGSNIDEESTAGVLSK